METYKIVVTQIIQTEREVKASSFEELKAKLDDQGEWIGKCTKPSFVKDFNGRVCNEKGETISIVSFM